MPDSFGPHSTADDVLVGCDLRGKRFLVTGVSSGLGVETARALVARGAQVVGAVRDLTKAEAASKAVRHAVGDTGGLELIELNLAELASVRACADALLAAEQPFDAVFANAGVMATPFSHTADGFETQFGVNHLGHFVLINRIVPLMSAGARVVTVSSAGHRRANVDLDDPNFEHRPYDPLVAYGQSKTANALFAVEFDRRRRGQGVRAAAVHPGVVETELTRHSDPAFMGAFRQFLNMERAAKGEPPFEPKTVAQGAATSVWAGVVAPADEVGGKYCEDCHVTTRLLVGEVGPIEEGVRAYAIDPNAAAALWARSEELVGEHF